MKILLEAKTNKGKNKINEKGKHAIVTYQMDSILCSDLKGKFLFIEPHFRWINQDNDPDFKITILEDIVN